MKLGILKPDTGITLGCFRQVVSRGVAHEFATVVHRLELHYVNSMLERPEQKPSHDTSDTAADASSSAANGEADVSYWAILNGFFPFDPYQLAKSSVFVDDLYVEYQEVNPTSAGVEIDEKETGGIGFRETGLGSEDDELDRLLSVSMSLSV